jgi:hypothetical protein
MTLTTPITTPKFTTTINMCGLVHNYSSCVSHYEVCIIFLKDQPKNVCAYFKVLAKSTQTPLAPPKNDYPINTMIGNKCTQQLKKGMNFSYNIIAILINFV